MTRWEQIDAELHAQRKTWIALGRAIGASKQSLTNYKSKGVPAKYFTAIDNFLNKPLGWTEMGEAFGDLVLAIEESEGWPFDLAGLTKDRYMALPTSSRGVVQAAMRSAIEAEEAQIAKQETPYKASRAA